MKWWYFRFHGLKNSITATKQNFRQELEVNCYIYSFSPTLQTSSWQPAQPLQSWLPGYCWHGNVLNCRSCRRSQSTAKSHRRSAPADGRGEDDAWHNLTVATCCCNFYKTFYWQLTSVVKGCKSCIWHWCRSMKHNDKAHFPFLFLLLKKFQHSSPLCFFTSTGLTVIGSHRCLLSLSTLEGRCLTWLERIMSWRYKHWCRMDDLF